MGQRIFVTGLPGVGKTTLAKQLSEQLNISFIDLDNYIEETQEQSITDIFNSAGEDNFRNIESHALRSYIQLNQSFIMACGGGVPCFNGNMDFMNQQGITIYYTQPLEVIAKQLLNDTTVRPLLRNITSEQLPTYLNSLLKKREPYYLKANIISDNLPSILSAIKHLEKQLKGVF